MQRTGGKRVDDYIAAQEPEKRRLLEQIRATVLRAAPKATEKIAYGIPTLYQGENLVHYAAFKNHIGFFPTPRGIEAFREEVAEYVTSKGTLQFPMDKPLPLKLVAKITKFRAAQSDKPAKAPRAAATVKRRGVRDSR